VVERPLIQKINQVRCCVLKIEMLCEVLEFIKYNHEFLTYVKSKALYDGEVNFYGIRGGNICFTVHSNVQYSESYDYVYISKEKMSDLIDKYCVGAK
ncbi:MAG: hypothetical protein ACRC5M_00755, partial [Anaeroplasmataceae bacterium]